MQQTFRFFKSHLDAKASLAGKTSLITFFLVIFFGLISGLWNMLDPIGSDCSSQGFQGVNLAWYRAYSFMVGLFVTLFLVAVAVSGHSLVGCSLLLCAPAFNLLNYIFLRKQLEYVSASEETLSCVESNIYQILFFLGLCLVAVVTALLDRQATVFRQEDSLQTENTPLV